MQFILSKMFMPPSGHTNRSHLGCWHLLSLPRSHCVHTSHSPDPGCPPGPVYCPAALLFPLSKTHRNFSTRVCAVEVWPLLCVLLTKQLSVVFELLCLSLNCCFRHHESLLKLSGLLLHLFKVIIQAYCMVLG